MAMTAFRMSSISTLYSVCVCVAGFLLGLFFDPEDGSNMFLRNVG
jgi:hypothetical protein